MEMGSGPGLGQPGPSWGTVVMERGCGVPERRLGRLYWPPTWVTHLALQTLAQAIEVSNVGPRRAGFTHRARLLPTGLPHVETWTALGTALRAHWVLVLFAGGQSWGVAGGSQEGEIQHLRGSGQALGDVLAAPWALPDLASQPESPLCVVGRSGSAWWRGEKRAPGQAHGTTLPTCGAWDRVGTALPPAVMTLPCSMEPWELALCPRQGLATPHLSPHQADNLSAPCWPRLDLLTPKSQQGQPGTGPGGSQARQWVTSGRVALLWPRSWAGSWAVGSP